MVPRKEPGAATPAARVPAASLTAIFGFAPFFHNSENPLQISFDWQKQVFLKKKC